MDTKTSISKRTSAAGGCFHVIVDQAQEAIALLDTNGVLHYANAAWAKMHGYGQPNEILGKNITAFHNKEQLHADIFPLLLEVKSRGQISGPIGHIHKNGTVIPTITTMTALKDETGKVRAVIVYAMDTTELEKLKEEIRNLNVEKEKETSELMARLQQQYAEHARQENQWEAKYDVMSDAIETLRQELVDMRQYELEFLDGIDEYDEMVGAKSELDQEEIKQLSSMARKLAT
jgi:PAS domain S-box-containing protein